MTARYWVLASDELIETMDPSLLPDGIRLTGIRADWDPAAHLLERSHWYLVTDDEAPNDLDGRQVELVLGRRGREGARSVIIERRVVA